MDPTTPARATRDTERDDARQSGHADRMPTPDEERRAEEQELPEGAAEHYEEMAERGAHQQGEGRID